MNRLPAVLVSDYDGTLAEHGRVAATTVAALERLRAAGRRSVLVTGRQLEDLQSVFPRLDLFDYAAVENGAVLFRPEDGELTLLASPPPESFLHRLASAGVDPLSVGRVIVATDLRWLRVVRKAIRDAGLPHRIILNKGAVMVLPAGIDKAFGMRTGLRRLELSPADALGIGDAENDLDFLAACAWPAAVANALPAVKAVARSVTDGSAGAGVEETIGRLLAGELPPGDRRRSRGR